MGNMLQDGLAWLAGQLAQHAAEEVEYFRGAERIVLLAVPAEVEIETLDGAGLLVVARATDFLVRTEDLLLGGEASEPRAGDRIRRSVGVRLVTYEAMPLGPKSHFEAADPYRIQWRIHTKQVLVE